MRGLIRTVLGALVPARRSSVRPSQALPAPLGAQPVAFGSNKLKATLLGDRSGSIESLGLVEALCGTFDRTLASIASVAGSLARIVLFNDTVEVHTGRDRNHRGDNESQFVPAIEAARRSVASFYRSAGGTYLERYLARELQVLLRSFGEDRSSTFTHVLFLFTDGKDEAPQDFKRGEDIRGYMSQIVSLAERCGGVTQSRIVVFYVGIGLTPTEHQKTARDLGFPMEWVHHVPATAQAVEGLGHTVSHTVMGVSQGHTQMHPPRRQHRESDTPTPV